MGVLYGVAVSRVEYLCSESTGEVQTQQRVNVNRETRRGPWKLPPNMAAQYEAGIDGAALKKVFSELVEGLKAVDVIDDFYENDLLSSEEYDGIFDACLQASSKEDSRNVNRRVLIAIRRRPPGFVAKLVETLRKKHRSLADALEKGERRCNASTACSVMCMKEVTLTPTVINWNVVRYCSFFPQP